MAGMNDIWFFDKELGFTSLYKWILKTELRLTELEKANDRKMSVSRQE